MPATTCVSPRLYLIALRRLLTRIDSTAIDAYARALYRAWREEQQVFVFGNGGSAATASHAVADLLKTAAVDGKPRLRAMCLSDNISLLTAIGNDIDYENVFLYPLQTFARPGDVAVAYSASGNSPNVVDACRWARANGLVVVAITGFQGGRVATLADIHIHISSDNYGLVEDLHLAVGHMTAQALQARITAEVAVA